MTGSAIMVVGSTAVSNTSVGRVTLGGVGVGLGGKVGVGVIVGDGV